MYFITWGFYFIFKPELHSSEKIYSTLVGYTKKLCFLFLIPFKLPSPFALVSVPGP